MVTVVNLFIPKVLRCSLAPGEWFFFFYTTVGIF